VIGEIHRLLPHRRLNRLPLPAIFCSNFRHASCSDLIKGYQSVERRDDVCRGRSPGRPHIWLSGHGMTSWVDRQRDFPLIAPSTPLDVAAVLSSLVIGLFVAWTIGRNQRP
jgi:hypothetical protein